MIGLRTILLCTVQWYGDRMLKYSALFSHGDLSSMLRYLEKGQITLASGEYELKRQNMPDHKVMAKIEWKKRDEIR